VNRRLLVDLSDEVLALLGLDLGESVESAAARMVAETVAFDFIGLGVTGRYVTVEFYVPPSEDGGEGGWFAGWVDDEGEYRTALSCNQSTDAF
jgi:hypothetical protein